jgi:hypothetical protein
LPACWLLRDRHLWGLPDPTLTGTSRAPVVLRWEIRPGESTEATHS